jgi:hypothetical protein
MAVARRVVPVIVLETVKVAAVRIAVHLINTL